MSQNTKNNAKNSSRNSSKKSVEKTADTNDDSDIIKQSFEICSRLITKLKVEQDDDTKLALYGLYKQSTEGDCKRDRPGVFNVVGRKKWDKWMEYHGLSQNDAMCQHVELSTRLINEYGVNAS